MATAVYDLTKENLPTPHFVFSDDEYIYIVTESLANEFRFLAFKDDRIKNASIVIHKRSNCMDKVRLV